ncbi:hypothetical protein CAEBREN_02724 [Caenorhabditis brenneri]|uniref:Uncharacterized protein n=1 Tax=Caenorhabditis brenneri TaxID=135651 RepID=G0MF02_CAEBE|nr:hypothetical protein CAEBREN_02724 [Caenorhabditis brenneri]
MENRTVSSTSSSFEFSFEEALRQRRASEEIANICGNLQVQIKKLENQLEVSYEDKKKFLCLIDELEVQMEKLHLKYQRDIENEKEKAADFNAEVMVCHRHIEELEEKLKVKNRQIELHYEYMAARALEKQEMKKRVEELEDQLQLMQVQTMELDTLREENEILKKVCLSNLSL